MVKIYRLSKYFFWILFLTSCSISNPAGIWLDKSQEIRIAKKNANTIKIFKEREQLNKEVTTSKNIVVSSAITNDFWLEENLVSSNYIPHLEYENKKSIILKSRKLGKNKFKSENIDFEPLISNGSLFFYDPSGNIYNYSYLQKKIEWKFNFYKKRYKKIPILINLKIEEDNLIVSDNLGYLYSIDLVSGKLVWAENYGVPFRSSIKTADDKIFLINQDNKFYSVKKINGKREFDLETFPSFLKSRQKSNIVLNETDKNVFFVTSTGELYSIDYANKNINWMFNSSAGLNQANEIFFSSPLVFSEDKIFFSTSSSTYSISTLSGTLNWELPFSTYIRPIVIDNFIFLISKEGFLLCLNNLNGEIIWSKKLFNKKKFNIGKIGEIYSALFISNQIFLTTKNGYFLFVDYKNGELIDYARVAKGFFSKPVVVNGNTFVIDKNIRILQLN